MGCLFHLNIYEQGVTVLLAAKPQLTKRDLVMSLKTVAFLTLIAIPLSIWSVNSVVDQKPEGYTADDAVNLNPDPTGPIIPKVISNPELVLKANKGTPKEKLFDINQKINKDKIAEKKAS
jgi:hypothetical protein